MSNENTRVYIFAAEIFGLSENGYLHKAGKPETKERAEFLNTVLNGREKELDNEQILLLTPANWLSGCSVHPAILHSSSACESLVKRAKEYLLRNEIVVDCDALDALSNTITVDNWSQIVHVTYIVDMDSKVVIQKL